jgi:hypothetical protein
MASEMRRLSDGDRPSRYQRDFHQLGSTITAWLRRKASTARRANTSGAMGRSRSGTFRPESCRSRGGRNCRMLDQAGYAHLNVFAFSGVPNLHGHRGR